MIEPIIEKPDTLSLCTLASGSRGNSIYVSDGQTRLLVDAGLSASEIQRRMQAVRLKPEMLDGLIVSHEHSDHVQGIGVLSRRFKLPVYLTEATRQAAARLGKLHAYQSFRCGASFRVKSLQIHPFSISHDATDPAGFTIAGNGKRIGIATDLGKATGVVNDHLSGCAMIVLEANHDPQMLTQGPYPWHLKQRIRSRHGHLSNIDSSRLLKQILNRQLKCVVLAHLSETNNTAEKAYAEIAAPLAQTGIKVIVADQHQPGPILHV